MQKLSKDLPEGHQLQQSDIAFKRCDVGLSPDKAGLLLGRVTSSVIKKNDVIDLDKLNGSMP